jgi:hypothetical protein
MPDGSEECGIILAKLDVQHDRLNDIDSRLEAIERRLQREDGFKDGATWVAARVGSVVILIGSATIWVFSGGLHSVSATLKEWLDRAP